eukprot:Colp12_sorted_trinity150504_noHs@16016
MIPTCDTNPLDGGYDIKMACAFAGSPAGEMLDNGAFDDQLWDTCNLDLDSVLKSIGAVDMADVLSSDESDVLDELHLGQLESSSQTSSVLTESLNSSVSVFGGLTPVQEKPAVMFQQPQVKKELVMRTRRHSTNSSGPYSSQGRVLPSSPMKASVVPSSPSPQLPTGASARRDSLDLTNLQWLTNINLHVQALDKNTQDKTVIAGKQNPQPTPAPTIPASASLPQGHAAATSANPPFRKRCHSASTELDEQQTMFAKPPYSFSCLIALAIDHHPEKRMTVKELYAWIKDRFPYFCYAKNGWKNSIRHNLSLNKCFMKIARDKNEPGKGSHWGIDPQQYAAFRAEVAKFKGPLPPSHSHLFPNETQLRRYNSDSVLSQTSIGSSVSTTTRVPLSRTQSSSALPSMSFNESFVASMLRNQPIVELDATSVEELLNSDLPNVEDLSMSCGDFSLDGSSGSLSMNFETPECAMMQ